MLDMTDQQLNQAIGELMGYTVEKEATGGYTLKYNGEDQGKRWMRAVFAWEQVPDYCADPAASLEVQTAAIKANDRQYAINLAKRLEWDGDDLEYSDNDVFSYTGVTVFMLASPRERAEAAYLTLSNRN
ncbi:hypothetical protein [Paenibacillus sp. EKM206P]|uniref:hypothetical protein n=1 Tax=Paenibacillus sp. EKM206P TaxID=1683674 RepID=UPI001EEABD0B|nr:hypothetical protein [Paenibacillus sp. EKM206P]